MSILIRGMKMPKNCIDCAFGWNGWCHRINSRAFVEVDMRRHDCPLVELPPHGRLIDADALIKGHFSDEHRIAMSYADKCWMRRIINGEPTIIPAGKEETE